MAISKIKDSDGTEHELNAKYDSNGKQISTTYLPLAGGSMSQGATIKLNTYGTRFLTLSGNSISADMSNETGGWAGNFASVKDPSGTTTPMLGWYGGASGLTHIYMGGTYSDPFLKFTPAGIFTFKNTPKVGSTDVALKTDIPTVSYPVTSVFGRTGAVTLTKSDVTTALGYTPPTQDTTYSVATTTADGLMSSTDKSKLNKIEALANRTIVDSALSSTSTNPVQNKVINTALDDKANKTEGIFFVQGTGTTAGTWIGTSDRITEYYDGLTIKYKISIAGASTTKLNINDLGAKTVYRWNDNKLTTQFPVGSIITLTYHADLNGGCWITNDYDSNTNTYQRVYESSSNVEYPITTRYNTTDGSTYYAEYGRYTNGVTLNPSTNTITASAFKGALTGNADTATKATQDGNGKVISSTYLPANGWSTTSTSISNGNVYLGKDQIYVNDDEAGATYHYYFPTKSGTVATTDDIQTYIDTAILGGSW